MSHTPETIEVLARGVCVVDGHILVCHTAGASNTYLPGGHVEFREAAKVSLEREIQEECGLPSRVGRFLGAVEHAFMQKGKPHAEVNLVFALEVPGLMPGRPVPSQEAHIDFRWEKVEALADSGLEPRVLQALIPRWLAGPESNWASSI